MRFISNYRALHRAADRHVAGTAAILTDAVGDALARVSEAQLEMAVQAGNADLVLDLLNTEGGFARALRVGYQRRLLRVLRDGAQAALGTAVR